MTDQERDQIFAVIEELFNAEIQIPRCTICGEPDLSALILFTTKASFCSDCLGIFLAMPGESSAYECN